MDLLIERILKDCKVRPGNILKVSSFLNHQIDVELLDAIGKEFYEHFKDKGINKIMTIESSGIAIAIMTARYFKVPMVFAKKSKTSNLDPDIYSTSINSYTHGTVSKVIVESQYLTKDDRVLILDDFLASGKALIGLKDLIDQAGATVEGIGIVIEKGFQNGGDNLRSEGFDVYSLANIASMSVDDGIKFR